ncbi:DapH/DapD/GlmU-related protein [Paenibacillus medicaginis]|uniref:DapH/DapD/GlmU-related protein n=1 Tax=Paenibacillus medicaginis TaxID=1470560 RepID=A0ABV5C1M9_9BACL
MGNHTLFGPNVTVCGGVTIGDGCVIGAGSVVTRDIPASRDGNYVPSMVFSCMKNS